VNKCCGDSFGGGEKEIMNHETENSTFRESTNKSMEAKTNELL
jgi:hypothetical protein